MSSDPYKQLMQENRRVPAYDLPWIVQLLGLPIAFPHELAHYLAGRLLGVPIRLMRFQVVYPRSTAFWKSMVIGVAPTLIALCFLIIPLFFLHPEMTKNQFLLLMSISGYGYLSLTCCLGDWRSLKRRWQKKKRGV